MRGETPLDSEVIRKSSFARLSSGGKRRLRISWVLAGLGVGLNLMSALFDALVPLCLAGAVLSSVAGVFVVAPVRSSIARLTLVLHLGLLAALVGALSADSPPPPRVEDAP